MSPEPSVAPALSPAPHRNGTPAPANDWSAQGKRIQELIERAANLPDPSARTLLHECLESLLTLHGQGLAQMLELIKDAGPEGKKLLDAVTQDPFLRGLLLIHGLHPVDLKTRIGAALNKVRPYMESHGGNVELLALENDVARLRLQGACKTCPSSAVTMELALRAAIDEFCPDLQGMEVEGVPQESPTRNSELGTRNHNSH
ncbi:MAG: thioredoxin-like protein [Pedosphaera sp.]|nr:thioredoxin-like protein [Pedosphaera sp.]